MMPLIVGDAVRNPEQEAQLDRQPDLRLIVLIDVRRRRVELLLAHLDVAGDEHALPRNLDVVEIEHRVVLVETARRADCRTPMSARLLVGFAREHLQALCIHRNREGDRVVLVAGLQRLDAGDEHFVGHDAAGASILAPRIVMPSASRSTTPAVRNGSACSAGALRAVRLRIDDDVGEIEIVVARVAIVSLPAHRPEPDRRP